MCELNIEETITGQRASHEKTQIKRSVTLAQRLIGDVFALARHKVGELPADHPVIPAPDQGPHAQLAGREALRGISPPARELVDILPSKTTDQGHPVGRSVFDIGSQLILVEMTA